jgi:hypothetical protein
VRHKESKEAGVQILQVHGVDLNRTREVYAKTPALSNSSFRDQLRVLASAHHHNGVLICDELRSLGVSCLLTMANCQELQLQWAYENNKTLSFPDYWEMELLLEQINRLRPRFLFISTPELFDSHIIRMLTWKPEGIMGWLTNPSKKEVDWTLFDVMFTNHSSLDELAIKRGAKNVRNFPPAVLPPHPALSEAHYDCAVFLEQNQSYFHSAEIFDELLAIRKENPFAVRIFASPLTTLPENIAPFVETLPDSYDDSQRARASARTILHLEADWRDGSVGSSEFFRNLASGRPVVMPHYRDVARFLLPGYEAEIFEHIEEFRPRIKALLQNPARAQELAQRAFERFSTEHSLRARAQKLAQDLALLPSHPSPTNSEESVESVSYHQANPSVDQDTAYIEEASPSSNSIELEFQSHPDLAPPSNDELQNILNDRLRNGAHNPDDQMNGHHESVSSLGETVPEDFQGGIPSTPDQSSQQTLELLTAGNISAPGASDRLNLLDVLEEALSQGKIKVEPLKEHIDSLSMMAATSLDQIINLAINGKPEEAEELLRAFRSREPEPILLPPNFKSETYSRSEKLLQQARNLYNEAQYSACLKLLHKINLLEEDPNPDVLLLRAKCIAGFDTPESVWNARCAALEAARLFPDDRRATQIANDYRAKVTEQRSPYLSFEDDFRKIYEKVEPYSMLPELTLFSLYSRVKLILDRGVEGSLVDLGCSAGGAALLMALTIKRFAHKPRDIFVFDTFDGMPRCSSKDKIFGIKPVEVGWGEGTCKAREEHIQSIFREHKVDSMLRVKKGLIENTFPCVEDEIECIALANIDLGLHSSTGKALDLITPLLHRDASLAVHHGLGWNGVEDVLEAKLNSGNFRLKKISEECAIFWLGAKVGFAWTDSRLGSTKEYL